MNMKKLSLTLAALAVAALPAVAVAQTATATVTASATVVADLTATTTHQLKFGTLALGSSSTLAPNGASQAALSGLTTAGLGQVQVNHNSNVAVTTTVPSVLTNSVSGNSLGFAATCATASTSGGTGAAVAGGCNSFSLNATTAGTPQSTYVLVGGTITGSAAAGIGTFSGNVVFNFNAVN
jgi:hypothetical protein